MPFVTWKVLKKQVGDDYLDDCHKNWGLQGPECHDKMAATRAQRRKL